MRTSIVLVLVLFLCSPCLADTETVTVGQLTTSSPTYTDIIFFASFSADGSDNLETSNCNNGTDTTWSRQSGALINADAKLVGDYGLDCPTGSDYAIITVTSNDYFNPTKGAVVFAFRVTAQQIGQGFLRINGTTDLVIRAGVSEGTKNQIRTVWGADGENIVMLTTDANIATGTWYWLVYKYDSDNDDQEVHIYLNSDSSEAGTGKSDLTSEMNPLDTVGAINVGDFIGVTDSDIHIDHLVIFNGSISRTPAQYLAIAKGNATCPR